MWTPINVWQQTLVSCQSTDSHKKQTLLMQTIHYQLCAVINLSFWKVKNPSVNSKSMFPKVCSTLERKNYRSQFQTILASQHSENDFDWVINYTDERFLSVSVNLSCRMMAFWRLEIFSLTMLMSSFISLVFCWNKICIFDSNNTICLIHPDSSWDHKTFNSQGLKRNHLASVEIQGHQGLSTPSKQDCKHFLLFVE